MDCLELTICEVYMSIYMYMYVRVWVLDEGYMSVWHHQGHCLITAITYKYLFCVSTHIWDSLLLIFFDILFYIFPYI